MKCHLSQSGWSVLESLAVLAIMAILTTMAIPNLNEMLANFRLDGAAKKMVSDLRLARQLAITHRIPMAISLNPENENYTLVQNIYRNPSVVFKVDFTDPALGWHEIDLVRSTKGNQIVFSPLGTTGSWTTISLQNRHGKEEKITVIGTGRIKRKK